MSYLEMENHIFCSYGYWYGFHAPNDRHKLIHVWISLTGFGYILLKKKNLCLAWRYVEGILEEKLEGGNLCF